MNLLAILPIAIFAILVAAFFLPGLGRENPNDLPSTRVGHPAPALFISEDQNPETGFTDATLREPGLKMVNFWASWCGPCRAEHPNLMKLSGMGLPIYGINYKDRPEDAAKFLAELGNPFIKGLSDPKGRNGIEWGVTGVPESLLIDGEGKILWHFRGPITQRIIEGQIKPFLEKPDVNG